MHGPTRILWASLTPLSLLQPLFHENADVIHALQTGFIGEAGEWVTPNNDKVNSSMLWLDKPGLSSPGR